MQGRRVFFFVTHVVMWTCIPSVRARSKLMRILALKKKKIFLAAFGEFGNLHFWGIHLASAGGMLFSERHSCMSFCVVYYFESCCEVISAEPSLSDTRFA